MSVLNVTNVPDNDKVVAELARRATAHRVSETEELLQILKAAFGSDVTPDAGSQKSGGAGASLPDLDGQHDVPDWLFDRHDLRYGQPLLPPGEDFKAHLLALGEIGPDIRLDRPRTFSEHRTIDL